MPQEVKLYTTPTCVPCKAVKRFFDERGVDFTEIDVAADREAMQELVRISGNITVPVVTKPAQHSLVEQRQGRLGDPYRKGFEPLAEARRQDHDLHGTSPLARTPTFSLLLY